MTRRYDEKAVAGTLEGLPLGARVAFAVACAERQFLAYVTFSRVAGRGNPRSLEQLLERVWQEAIHDGTRDDGARLKWLSGALAECLSLIPDEDEEPWVVEQVYAESAATGVAYALRTLGMGRAQDAAWAARTAYDSLDHHIANRLGVEGEDTILSHPLMQAELQRQRVDLEELCSNPDALDVMIVRLRDRARRDAHSFFSGDRRED